MQILLIALQVKSQWSCELRSAQNTNEMIVQLFSGVWMAFNITHSLDVLSPSPANAAHAFFWMNCWFLKAKQRMANDCKNMHQTFNFNI